MGDVHDSCDDPRSAHYRLVDVQDSTWAHRRGIGDWRYLRDGGSDFWSTVCPFGVGALAVTRSKASFIDTASVRGDCIDLASVGVDVSARLSVELYENRRD